MTHSPRTALVLVPGLVLLLAAAAVAAPVGQAPTPGCGSFSDPLGDASLAGEPDHSNVDLTQVGFHSAGDVVSVSLRVAALSTAETTDPSGDYWTASFTTRGKKVTVTGERLPPFQTPALDAPTVTVPALPPRPFPVPAQTLPGVTTPPVGAGGQPVPGPVSSVGPVPGQSVPPTVVDPGGLVPDVTGPISISHHEASHSYKEVEDFWGWNVDDSFGAYGMVTIDSGAVSDVPVGTRLDSANGLVTISFSRSALEKHLAGPLGVLSELGASSGLRSREATWASGGANGVQLDTATAPAGLTADLGSGLCS